MPSPRFSININRHEKSIAKQWPYRSLYRLGAVTLVAGTAAYLFLTENGIQLRNSMKKKAKDAIRDVASAWISKKTGIDKLTVRKAAGHVG